MGKKIDTNQSHTAKSSTHAAINDPAEIGSSKKQSKNRANPQSGNVFFTLFGAVAVVGVLGAGIMSTMRGPLSTMVDVNKIEQTKSEMRVGLGILLQDATDQDTDALTEPKEPSNCGGDPVSCVPNDVASPKTDPWGNSYRYCAWNNGSDATTIGANNLILAGGSAATNIAVAMVSAGPDGVFQNNCLDSSNGLNSYIKTQSEAAGDDLVVAMTYTEAVSGSGGLWTASTSGGDNVATINQDLDLTGSTAAGYSSVQLKLGAASMLLPDSTAIPNCTSGNADLVRINKTVTPFRIENCYWNGTVGTWVAGAQIWSTGTGDDIYYNTGTPQVGIGTATPDDTLDVVGTAQITGASVLGSTLNVTGDYTSVAGDINAVDGTFSGAVSGASGTFTGAGTGLSVTNNANIGGTLGAGASTLASLIVTGTSNLQGDVSDSLGDFTIADTAVITGATTLQSTLDIQGTISNSTGTDPVTIGDTLSVTDVATFSGAGNGLIVSNNADIDGTLEADEYTWGGVDFTPPSTCTDADEKLYWDATSGWLCHNIGSNGDGDGLDISANVLNDLSDVDTSPSDGDCLVFDTTPDPDEWVSVPCSTAAATIWEEFENGASDIIRLSDSGNYATDDFVFGSSQLDDIDGDSDDDIRMFFDKSKGAFRAGNASNDGHNAWNASSANVGDGSVAFGNNTLASGTNSMSWGIRNSGGQGAIGDNSTAFGYRTGALGDGSTAWGSGTFATGYFSTAFGSQVIAGSGTADATNTNGAGHGHHSIAIGMQSNNHTTKPIITGDRTMGIFFDQHTFDSNSTYDLTPDDTFALIGGQFMIGATEAAGAGQACLRYNSGDSTLEYTDDCTGTPTWTSFTNDISGLWTDLTGGRIHYGTTSANQVGIGTNDPQTTLDVNGGVRVGTTSGGDTPTSMALNDLSDTDAASPSTNQCLVFDGTNWANGSCASSSIDALSDADNDTQIQVEEGGDDDTIRFDTEGDERLAINDVGGITFYGSRGDTPAIDIGDACSVSGAVHTKSSGGQVINLICDGSNWLNTLILHQGPLPATNVWRGLHVAGSSNNNTDIHIKSASASNGYARLNFGGSWGTTTFGFVGTDGADNITNQALHLSTEGNRDIKIETASTEQARFNGTTGNFGLGDFGTNSDTIDSTLHLQAGDLRLDGGEANQAGCIRYDDTDDELEYSDDCSTYVAFNASGGASAINDLSDAYTDYTTDFNMYMGSSAGNTSSPGRYNIALGQNALDAMDGTCSGGSECDLNIAIGYNALTSLTTGAHNVAVGGETGENIDTGDYNSLFGTRAGEGIEDGSNNVLVGRHSGRYITSGSTNVFLGSQAGEGNGSNGAVAQSVAIGSSAMNQLSIGDTRNVYVGYFSGYQNSGGSDNVGLGWQALRYFDYADSAIAGNTAVGKSALEGVSGSSTGTQNTALGYQAGNSITSGAGNILIGYDVDVTAATASNELNIGDVIIGDLGASTIKVKSDTSDAFFYIESENPGNLARLGLFEDGAAATPDGFIFEYNGDDNRLDIMSRVGTYTPRISVTRNDGFMGFGDFTGGDTIDDMLHLQSGEIRLDGGSGNQAGCLRFDDTDDELEYSDDCSTFTSFASIGTAGATEINELSDAFADYTTNDNMFLGNSAGNSSTGGSENVAIGESAMAGLDTTCTGNECDRNTVLGYAAMPNISTGYFNTVIGAGAADSIGTNHNNVLIGKWGGLRASGNENVIIGSNTVTGSGARTIDSSVIIGYDAAGDSTLTNAIVIGDGAGYLAESDHLIAIGEGAGYNHDGDNSIVIGDGTGNNADGDSGIYIGNAAGVNSDGNSNIYIGASAGDSGITGTSNIIIGNSQDTPTTATSNHLNIGGTIYADMSNDYVGIGTASPDEGQLEVKGGTVCVDTNSDDTASSCIANESDERLKKNVKDVDYGLETLMQMRPVSFDWKYDDPEILKHYPLIKRYKANPHAIGFIAQDIQKLMPEVIESETVGDAQEQYLQLDYAKLTPVVVKAVQQLKAENEALKSELADIKTAQNETYEVLASLGNQVELLSKIASTNNTSKASMESILMLLLGLIGGGTIVFMFSRKKA